VWGAVGARCEDDLVEDKQRQSDSLVSGGDPAAGVRRFELRERLSARRYLATDLTTGSAVVVKTVPIHSVPAGSVMQFEYEASRRQQMSSPWLVSPSYVGREAGQLILALPFVAGFLWTSVSRADD